MFRSLPLSLAQPRDLPAFTYHRQARLYCEVFKFHHSQPRSQLFQPTIRIPQLRWICTNHGNKGGKEETREEGIDNGTGNDKNKGGNGGKEYENIEEVEKKRAEAGDFRAVAPWLVTIWCSWYIQGSERRKQQRKDWDDEVEANKNCATQKSLKDNIDAGPCRTS
jgi:hypothetical protein